MNKNFLSESEIRKHSRKYRRNEKKRQLFEKEINNPYLKVREGETRIQAFERAWKTGLKIARKKRGFIKRGQRLTEDVVDYVKESIYYKSSVIDNIINPEDKISNEQIIDAEKITYENRTKEFFDKHGNEMFKYSNSKLEKNEEKSLNDWFDDYKNGIIDKKTMNDIIKVWQDLNPQYDSSTYKGKYRPRR